MNEQPDIIATIGPKPTINDVFLDVLHRIDALAARVDDIERRLNTATGGAFEVRVGGSTESEGSR